MILNRQRAVRLARGPLESFLRRVKAELGLGQAGITVCLVSDTEIAQMNETFRKKKGSTDVLSFPSAERRRPARFDGGRFQIKADEDLGDIAISPVTARHYAKKHARHLPGELRFLILHGTLHLLGYDHETDRGEMRRLERKLRKRLGLT
jgi:probable rRNA maturation factor